LPFIILSATGIFFIRRHVSILKPENYKLLAPIVGILGIFSIGILCHVNNGIRQLLCAYPLLCILAGYGSFELLSLGKHSRAGLVLVVILFSWHLESSFAAHPDYLAYYNELASSHVEEFGADSNLDWGQDLKRLAITLKNRNVSSFKIKYSSTWGINLDLFNLPPREELKPHKRVTGWVAVSIGNLLPGADQYALLKSYQPVEKIGKSILLYYIP
jgi:hypothetical protein